jgi:hypothetical protein
MFKPALRVGSEGAFTDKVYTDLKIFSLLQFRAAQYSQRRSNQRMR